MSIIQHIIHAHLWIALAVAAAGTAVHIYREFTFNDKD